MDEIVASGKPPRRRKKRESIEDLNDRRSIRTMRERVAYCLMFTFMFVTVTVMAIIVLNGLGITAVPVAIVATLIAETVVHGIAMFCTLTRWLYR
jgi:hypothetical protein